MKKIIKSIGIHIPSIDENDHLQIDSFSSLSETDIAIFSPNLKTTSYSNFSRNRFAEIQGRKLYNKESSAKILDHIKHWKRELVNFVEKGGTLVIVLCSKENFAVHYKETITGTKKKPQINQEVMPFSNYDYLPFKGIEFIEAIGDKVYSSGSISKELHKSLDGLFNYKVHIKSSYKLKPIFTTKNQDKALGFALKLKGGNLILLPNIIFEGYKHHDGNSNYSWDNEGIKWGNIFVKNIIEINKNIRKKSKGSPAPTWINQEQFNLKNAENSKKIIAVNNSKIEKIKEENDALNSSLAEQEHLKDLLFESGKPLEAVVIKALQILGYNAENYDDGELELDQVITSPEGDRFIGECEGKDNKAISVEKFRQLLDGINADFERDEVDEEAFGLLFGNPQRMIEPFKRTLDFTAKCSSRAKSTNIGLILTKDLFEVARYVDENNDQEFAKACREAVKNQLGQKIAFPSIPIPESLTVN